MFESKRSEPDSSIDRALVEDCNLGIGELRAPTRAAMVLTALTVVAPLAQAWQSTVAPISPNQPTANELIQSDSENSLDPAQNPGTEQASTKSPAHVAPSTQEPISEGATQSEGWSRYWKGFSTAGAIALAYAAAYRLIRKVSAESRMETKDKLDFEAGKELHSAKINLHIITEEKGLSVLRIQTIDKVPTTNIFATASSRYYYERVARECEPGAQLVVEHYEAAAKNWWSRRFFGLLLPLTGTRLATPEVVRDRHNDDLGAILSKLNVQGAQRKEAGEDVVSKPFVMIDTCEAKPNGTMDLIMRVVSYEDFLKFGDREWFGKLVKDNPDYENELNVMRTAFRKELQFQEQNQASAQRQHLSIEHPRRSEPPDRTLFPWARWFLTAPRSTQQELAPAASTRAQASTTVAQS